MASFFGSVATEVGETVKDLGQQKREERLANEEAQREMQLQKMRMQFESSELDRRISADDKRQQRRIDYERAQADADAQREAEESAATREHQMSIEQLRSDTDLIQEAMKQYFSKTRTRTMSGNGFTMKNDPQQTIDPLSGQIIYQDNWSGTAPGGQPLSVVGDKVFRGGGSQEVYPFQSIEQQRQAEQALLEGKVNAERFYDDFGYYPSSYIFGQVSRDDANFQQWAERNNIRLPLMYAPGDRRGGGSKGSPESRLLPPKMEDDYEYPPAAPMQPSIEELSEGPERDAHIAARGGTNEEIAARMRAEAQGGGKLAQAERLTQGGQLEQPAGGGESPYGFELDEQGAADVASAVTGAMGPEAATIQQTGERYGYGGTL